MSDPSPEALKAAERIHGLVSGGIQSTVKADLAYTDARIIDEEFAELRAENQRLRAYVEWLDATLPKEPAADTSSLASSSANLHIDTVRLNVLESEFCRIEGSDEGTNYWWTDAVISDAGSLREIADAMRIASAAPPDGSAEGDDD